MKLNINRLLM